MQLPRGRGKVPTRCDDRSSDDVEMVARVIADIADVHLQEPLLVASISLDETQRNLLHTPFFNAMTAYMMTQKESLSNLFDMSPKELLEKKYIYGTLTDIKVCIKRLTDISQFYD